jgi:hypothetical protein
MNKLPEKIELDIHGETIEFSLTDKREIKYHGKSKTSNESLWRTDKLDDNEVFYQTEWGWGVFVTVEERELSLEERYKIALPIWKEKYGPLANMMVPTNVDNTPYKIPTKQITLTYNDKTITSYE